MFISVYMKILKNYFNGTTYLGNKMVKECSAVTSQYIVYLKHIFLVWIISMYVKLWIGSLNIWGITTNN